MHQYGEDKATISSINIGILPQPQEHILPSLLNHPHINMPIAATDARPVGHPLVEIPTGWNNEDMMALQYFPHLDNRPSTSRLREIHSLDWRIAGCKIWL
jgi:hypothetical protein